MYQSLTHWILSLGWEIDGKASDACLWRLMGPIGFQNALQNLKHPENLLYALVEDWNDCVSEAIY